MAVRNDVSDDSLEDAFSQDVGIGNAFDIAFLELQAICPGSPPRVVATQKAVDVVTPPRAVATQPHGLCSQMRIASLALLAAKTPLPSRCGEISRALPKPTKGGKPKKKCNITPKMKAKTSSGGNNIGTAVTPTKTLSMGRHAVVSRAYKHALRVATADWGLAEGEAKARARAAHKSAGEAWDKNN